MVLIDSEKKTDIRKPEYYRFRIRVKYCYADDDPPVVSDIGSADPEE